MIPSASVLEQPSRRASPKGVMPYTMPKLTIFAPDRCSLVTSSNGTPCTWAATAVWMSSPRSKAWQRAGSSDRWARMRSSICE